MKLNKTMMMAAGAALLCSSVQAVEIDYFAGMGLGYQADEIEGVINKDTEDLSYQARVGMLIEQNHRITGTFGYMEDKFNFANDKYKQEQYSWLVSYDYLLPVHKDVNLFAGVSIGANDNKVSGKSATDFVYGGQVGVQYKWSEHFSSDLGYRYLAQDYEESGNEINNSQQVYLTLDYKF
ncbi:outer membrane beta-barrel protein [Shewanella mangrovisoli]|uniref:outer membrane beta-barrel protein n=1 Tax=Shewanella mangrovisoli TaxID=2864211 RepID=UPI0035B8CD71